MTTDHPIAFGNITIYSHMRCRFFGVSVTGLSGFHCVCSGCWANFQLTIVFFFLIVDLNLKLRLRLCRIILLGLKIM